MPIFRVGGRGFGPGRFFGHGGIVFNWKVETQPQNIEVWLKNKLLKEAPDTVRFTLFDSAKAIAKRMKASLKETKSGEIYSWRRAESGEDATSSEITPYGETREVKRFKRGPAHGKLFAVKLRTPWHKASGAYEAPAKDRGNLYKAIVARQTKRQYRSFQSEVGVSRKAPYAVYLEYGARRAHILPRPFLAPAVDREIRGGSFNSKLKRNLGNIGLKVNGL